MIGQRRAPDRPGGSRTRDAVPAPGPQGERKDRDSRRGASRQEPRDGASGGPSREAGATRTRLYRDGTLEREDFPVQDISDYVSDPHCTVWLDVCDPSSADFDMIAEEFGLHSLAVEDARHEHQRPKLDAYRTHLFLSAYAVTVEPVSGAVDTAEVSAFITSNALITVRRGQTCDVEPIVERWDGAPELAVHGVGFLVHGLLDFLVDGHFSAVQDLDDRLEELEDLLFEDSPREIQAVQRRSFDLRKSLVRLRRVVLPMREVVNGLLRRDLHVVGEPMLPYFHDVYDHVLRATEWTESLRDLVTTVMETNLTVQGNRMNLIMKKVTSWAAIIAVPTAVTGYYGQNVPYPGYNAHSGFWVSTALVVVLSVALYVTFRRRDWI
ncbi:magnesium transporter CorA family protein [Actinacidiphila paucisporea]|uniref:Magnesium transporter n=1 Tax=Actinacidiphila paucisporea TaxID=310782 RepID=A0A1M7P1G4_9ACTN|nr:magnesium transporter CorA family protein [Actinacidiphila paucisporea]SHN09795.1 magnesium transporter [Actinacidiphila paucisporea]